MFGVGADLSCEAPGPLQESLGVGQPGGLSGSKCTLIFLSLFFWKMARKTTKKTRISYPYRTPKVPGKEGKNAQKNKEFLAGEKNKEFQKSKARKDREVHRLPAMICGQSLRFVYAVKLYAAILSGK